MEPQTGLTPIVAKAPGKVNIDFRVGYLRPDGTRGVATIYQAVSIYDTVSVYANDSFTLSQAGSLGFGSIPPVGRNLAMRAAKLLAATMGVESGVHIEVQKLIPRGAGMSGGSADAAAALLACNELWGLGLSKSELQKIAVQLGADVSFLLEGGTALGTGHGDQFSQVLSQGEYHWVIVPVGPRIDEDEALLVLDKHRQKHREIIGQGDFVPSVGKDTLQAIRQGSAEALAEAMRNDVQAASFKLAPKLQEVCEYGEERGALAGIMLAMGPALAFLTPSADAAEGLQQALMQIGHAAIIAHGPVGGAKLTS